MAIFALRGATVAEDNARCYGVGTLQVRVVETLDMARLMFEVQLTTQSLHQSFGMAFGVADFEIFQLLSAVDSCPFLRKLQQFELVATLRNGESNALEKLHIGQKWHHNFACQSPRNAFADLLNCLCQHLLRIVFDTERKLRSERSCYCAIDDSHEIAIGRVVIDDERKDVQREERRIDNHRLTRIVLQRRQTSLVACRRLETQLSRSLVHLTFEPRAGRAQIAAQCCTDTSHVLVILLAGLATDARTFTVAEVVLQADLVTSASDLLGREIQTARA